VTTPSSKRVVILASAGLLWCVAVGLLLWFLPVGASSTSGSGGAASEGGRSFSSISALGPVPLIIPVVLATAALGSALTHRKAPLIAATVVLGGYALLTGFSIGLLYLPAVGASVAACVVVSNAIPSRRAQEPRSGPGARLR